METTLLYVAIGAGGIVAAMILVRVGWRAAGVYLIRRAGPRRLWSSRHVLWRDPGAVERLDLRAGPGGPDGRPVPPFRFVEEHGSGSQPCVSVRDGRTRLWRVKWGDEVRSENFAVRVAWAFAWLYRYLGRITDAQLRDGLEASGASEDEVVRFTRALRERIAQLGRAAGAVKAPAA